MPVANSEIATLLNRVAALLDIRGENAFRIRAYRNAARTVANLGQSVSGMVAEGGNLASLPGIGQDLADKIREIVETGTLGLLRDLGEETPVGLTELLAIPGLGPKRAAALHRELGIDTLKGLAKAARAGKVRELEGFGEKTERQILARLERHVGSEKRTKLAAAEEIVEPLIAHLQQVAGVGKVVVAGSYRRRRETVGDLDILVTCRPGAAVMDAFTGYDGVDEVLSRGETRASVRLRSGLQVDLRVVPRESYGAALHYFTGAKEHNVALRTRGVKKGLKVNEYGIFRGEKCIGGKTEEEVFNCIGLPFIVPELRENRGEIEAASEGKLPELISLEDIRGDLHAHTSETDGRSTLEEMAAAARERGYRYLAVTDHSRAVTVARGVDEKRLQQQIDAIDRLNEGFTDFRLLKGIEVDILEDGSLDLPDYILNKLDLTVCSVHSKFNLPAERQTERILRAMDNPCFNILGHPTGRLINEREPYALDMERLLAGARERGCFLELNAHPDRLDLHDRHCKMARDLGVKVAISTDAHLSLHLAFMRFGIGQARRGWLSRDDVLNTRSWQELKKLLRRG